MYVFVYIGIYVYLYIYVYIYVYTHIYTYILRAALGSQQNLTDRRDSVWILSMHIRSLSHCQLPASEGYICYLN